MAALIALKSGRKAEAQELAHESVPVLKQSAMQKDASAAELNLAARTTAPEVTAAVPEHRPLVRKAAEESFVLSALVREDNLNRGTAYVYSLSPGQTVDVRPILHLKNSARGIV